MRKSLLVVLVCVLLFSSLSVAAITIQEDTGDISNASQTFKMMASGSGDVVITAKKPPVIWEKPTLRSGEYMTRSSSLILQNATKNTQIVELETVELPYDNEDALRYLNHLTITVSNGNEVLYKGPYSRINDKDSHFTLQAELPADSQIAYSISLSCDFQYTGTGFDADDQIQWKFRTKTEVSDKADGSEKFTNPILLQVAVALGIALLLLGALTSYRYFKNR